MGHLVDLLKSCPHSGFPVVFSSPSGQNTFCGLILRSQICVLLSHTELFYQLQQPPTNPEPLVEQGGLVRSNSSQGSGLFRVRTADATAPWFQASRRNQQRWFRGPGQPQKDAEELLSPEAFAGLPGHDPFLNGLGQPPEPLSLASSSNTQRVMPPLEEPMLTGSQRQQCRGVKEKDRAAAFTEFMSSMEKSGTPLLRWEEFAKHYPVFPQINEMEFSEEERRMSIDLSPYMNTAAISLHHSTHVAKVQTLFRSLGLRHLAIVDTANQVVGIITRSDLMEFIHEGHKVRFDAVAEFHDPPTSDHDCKDVESDN